MDDTRAEGVVDALKKLKTASGDKTIYWRLVAKDADGDPALVVGRQEADVRSKATAIRTAGKDKRFSSGRVVKEGQRVVFGVDDGSLPRKDAEKALNKTLAADKRLKDVKTFLKAVEVVEGEAWAQLAPAVEGQAPREGEVGLGLSVDDLGLHDREQATAKKAGGKASTSSEKKQSTWVRLLERLDAFRAEFKGRELTDRDASRARALLDAIEADAKAWDEQHGKSFFDSKKTKGRREEVATLLEQVGKARRAIERAVGQAGRTAPERVGLDQAGLGTLSDVDVDPEVRERAEKGLDEGTYTVGRALKSGTEGTVHLLDGEGPKLVLKVPNTKGGREEMEKEAEVYAKLGDHPNIVRVYGVRKVGDQEGLAMEALTGGDVQDLLDDAPGMLAAGTISLAEFWSVVQHVLRGMIKGLVAMHEAGLGHNDIKPLNVMVDEQTGEAKLIDMGLVREVGDGVRGGTLGFMSGGHQVSEGHDVFAVGGTAFVAGEKKQFGYDDAPPVGWALMKPTKWAELGKLVFETDPKRSKDYEEFVNALMHPDPQQRPSLQQALSAPFLNDSMLDDDQSRVALKKMVALRRG